MRVCHRRIIIFRYVRFALHSIAATCTDYFRSICEETAVARWQFVYSYTSIYIKIVHAHRQMRRSESRTILHGGKKSFFFLYSLAGSLVRLHWPMAMINMRRVPCIMISRSLPCVIFCCYNDACSQCMCLFLSAIVAAVHLSYTSMRSKWVNIRIMLYLLYS